MDILADNIATTLQKIYEAHKFLLWQQANHHVVTPLQIQVLMAIHQKGTCRLSDLATMLQLSRPTLTDTLKSLERKKLICKSKCGHDGRSTIISLEKEGVQLALSVKDYNSQVKTIVSTLSLKERNHLQTTLLQVLEGLQEAGVVSLSKMCFTCSHYNGDKHKKHYCTLLHKDLRPEELQLDCSDHITLL